MTISSSIRDGEGATVVRSEERLVAGTTSRPARRAVVRKVIVAEERTVTVTVRHEEFRIDYVDVGSDDPEPAASLPAAASLPLELVLHEERVRVTTDVVPTERIRVGIRSVAEARVVTGEVRRERVEVDGEPLPDEATGARHRR